MKRSTGLWASLEAVAAGQLAAFGARTADADAWFRVAALVIAVGLVAAALNRLRMLDQLLSLRGTRDRIDRILSVDRGDYSDTVRPPTDDEI